MKKKVLFILLNDYADWEGAFLASALNAGVMPGSDTRYTVKTVAPTSAEVCSIGGFRTLPDYSFDTIPDDYAALILIGGMQWDSPEAERLLPILTQAHGEGKIIGAICNAASFLARHGFLNHAKHTGNGKDQLILWGGGNYTNPEGFVEAQAVCDNNIVTANGSAYLEFCRELLSALSADSPEKIEASYRFNKTGFYPV